MIRQLSVLVENKPGSLMEVTSRLTEAHVNIRQLPILMHRILESFAW